MTTEVPRALATCLLLLCLSASLALSLRGEETANPTVSLSASSVRVEESPESTITIEITISAPVRQAQVFGLTLQGTLDVDAQCIDLKIG